MPESSNLPNKTVPLAQSSARTNDDFSEITQEGATVFNDPNFQNDESEIAYLYKEINGKRFYYQQQQKYYAQSLINQGYKVVRFSDESGIKEAEIYLGLRPLDIELIYDKKPSKDGYSLFFKTIEKIAGDIKRLEKNEEKNKGALEKLRRQFSLLTYKNKGKLQKELDHESSRIKNMFGFGPDLTKDKLYQSMSKGLVAKYELTPLHNIENIIKALRSVVVNPRNSDDQNNYIVDLYVNLANRLQILEKKLPQNLQNLNNQDDEVEQKIGDAIVAKASKSDIENKDRYDFNKSQMKAVGEIFTVNEIDKIIASLKKVHLYISSSNQRTISYFEDLKKEKAVNDSIDYSGQELKEHKPSLNNNRKVQESKKSYLPRCFGYEGAVKGTDDSQANEGIKESTKSEVGTKSNEVVLPPYIPYSVPSGDRPKSEPEVIGVNDNPDNTLGRSRMDSSSHLVSVEITPSLLGGSGQSQDEISVTHGNCSSSNEEGGTPESKDQVKQSSRGRKRGQGVISLQASIDQEYTNLESVDNESPFFPKTPIGSPPADSWQVPSASVSEANVDPITISKSPPEGSIII